MKTLRFSVFLWRHTNILPENPLELTFGLKPGIKTGFFQSLPLVNQSASFSQPDRLYVFVEGLPNLFIKLPAKSESVKAEFLCDLPGF
jgi:hypothetical protein